MSVPDETLNDIRNKAGDLHDEQISWRRHLHRNPELSNEEHDTTGFLRDKTEEWGLASLDITSPTGHLAEIRGADGPTVAIRTDIDALPVQEKTGLPFASEIEGRMHACGHDMHMAAVLGAARILSEMKDRLPGTVRFLFQPAEEQPPGGAGKMIEDGALENVAMIFGLHVDPHIATGSIGLRDGVTMASVTDFNLTIRGRGGHGARPQDSVDAIATACEVVESLQKVVSRETDPITPVAITFGRIEGGRVRNVIADEVLLEGTARALSVKAARELPRRIRRTANGVCKARGASAEMEILGSYPVFVNDPKANTVLRSAFSRLYPRGRIHQTEQVLGAEDFSRYLELVPGAMFRLGIRNKKIGADKPWHSNQFVADEAALPFGTTLLATAAIEAIMELA
jgi:amidohydrolase